LIFDLRLSAASRQFEFDKRSQLFMRMQNESVSVVPIRITNEDRPPAGSTPEFTFSAKEKALP